jgi:hemerythrin-like domain-containing protein
VNLQKECAPNAMRAPRSTTRRETLLAGAAVLASGCATLGFHQGTPERRAEEIAPTEDLMREHGILDRLLLVYEEQERRLRSNEDFSPESLASTARLVRRFVEDYHERLEEEHVFPRLQQVAKIGDIVTVLRVQHERGRRLTDEIARLSTRAVLTSAADRSQLVETLHLYVRMFRPHAAREDTVIFPEFRHLLDDKELETLGETFEARERELFGPRGFEAVVDEVARLEREVRIHDLARFTAP